LRLFRLTDRDLAALAAGRPSPGTLAELRKAQLSRHLLLLSEILRAGTPSWYASPPARQILADPFTGLYAAAAVSTMRSGGRPPDRSALVGPAPVLAVTEHDLTLRIRLEDADPLRHRLGLPPTGRLSRSEIARWQRLLSEAWRLLVRRHRPAAEVLAEVMRVIVPVEPDPAAGGVSATSAHAYGAAAMSAPADARSLAVGLLHETAHSLLNGTVLLFDLVHPSRALGYSPWRDDPRPPSGVLHGAYAYLAVTRFWRTEAALGGGRLAQFEFARWRAAVAAAADALLFGPLPADPLPAGALPTDPLPTDPQPAEGLTDPLPTDPLPTDSQPAGGRGVLTAAGRRFVGALRDEVAPWLDEPVDEDVARLAEGADVEHRVRWRLRNLRVAEETTRVLAAAWADRRPAPELPEPEVVAGVRRPEANDRLGLVHGWLRGAGPLPPAPPGGDVRAGDIAWLGGAYETSRTAYVRALENGGATDTEAALTGLAMVSAQRAPRERPEVVRALWLALERRPALDDLVDWLDGR
jgi:HEXXH motif-containing protein